MDFSKVSHGPEGAFVQRGRPDRILDGPVVWEFGRDGWVSCGAQVAETLWFGWPESRGDRRPVVGVADRAPPHPQEPARISMMATPVRSEVGGGEGDALSRVREAALARVKGGPHRGLLPQAPAGARRGRARRPLLAIATAAAVILVTLVLGWTQESGWLRELQRRWMPKGSRLAADQAATATTAWSRAREAGD